MCAGCRQAIEGRSCQHSHAGYIELKTFITEAIESNVHGLLQAGSKGSPLTASSLLQHQQSLHTDCFVTDAGMASRCGQSASSTCPLPYCPARQLAYVARRSSLTCLGNPSQSGKHSTRYDILVVVMAWLKHVVVPASLVSSLYFNSSVCGTSSSLRVEVHVPLGLDHGEPAGANPACMPPLKIMCSFTVADCQHARLEVQTNCISLSMSYVHTGWCHQSVQLHSHA